MAFVGTPAGHEITSAGMVPADPVKVGALFVPVAVVVWVWVPRALPVNVGVCAIALATPPVVLESAPVVSALIVPAGVPPLTALDVTEFPVKVGAATVPAGVNDAVALVGTPAGHETTCAGPVTVPFVPAGVPALTALDVALDPVKVWAGTVPAFPVKDCAAAVNVATVGVMELAPPAPPTSPFAANVPSGIEELRLVTSVYPEGQAPVVIMPTNPDGTLPADESSTQVVPEQVHT